jgi:hypothetical protein
LSVAVLCLVGVLFSASSGVARPAPESPLDAAAQAGERDFGVPARLLVAVAEIDAHGRMPAGSTPDGGWGVMHLLATAHEDQVGRAARLAGLTPAAAKRDLTANVGAGAALLAGLAEGKPPDRLAAWRGRPGRPRCRAEPTTRVRPGSRPARRTSCAPTARSRRRSRES